MALIIPADFEDPRLLAFLEHHHRAMHAQTPKGSAHALDIAGLRHPSIAVWTAWIGEELAGTGALKRLSPEHGEVKSMRTAESHLRKGVATAMLAHIIAEAREAGMARLSLETGAFAAFAPAVTLYRRHGFTDCPPFGPYRPDPNSVFLTLDLAPRR